MEGKRRFTYCGDDKCDCDLRDLGKNIIPKEGWKPVTSGPSVSPQMSEAADLKALLERVKAASGADREIDAPSSALCSRTMAMGEVKLTGPERKLLLLAAKGELDTTWDHPDAASLAELGLLAVRRFRPGSAFVGGQTATITPAGRAALKETR